MGNQSHSLRALNLFVGLMRGNRWLAPASSELEAIGFDFLVIERSITTEHGTIRPDALAATSSIHHALLGEWSGHRLDERKRQQLLEFDRLPTGALVGIVGVPRDAAQTKGCWVIAIGEHASEFAELVRTRQMTVLVSSLGGRAEGGWELAAHGGTTGSADIDNILGTTLRFRRIPLGYCRVCLDNLGPHEMVEHSMHALLTCARRGSLEFTAAQLCAKRIWAWEAIAPEAQAAVTKAMVRVLNQMTKKTYLGDWLRRVGDNPPTYQISDFTDRHPSQMISAFERGLERFIAELSETPWQLSLFDDAGF